MLIQSQYVETTSMMDGWMTCDVMFQSTVFQSYSQGINESANLRFLQRLSVIFGFRRDRDLLLPAETVVLGKYLLAETVRVILLPLDRKQNHRDSLCRKPFFVDGSLDRKQEIADSLGGSQI